MSAERGDPARRRRRWDSPTWCSTTTRAARCASAASRRRPPRRRRACSRRPPAAHRRRTRVVRVLPARDDSRSELDPHAHRRRRRPALHARLPGHPRDPPRRPRRAVQPLLAAAGAVRAETSPPRRQRAHARRRHRLPFEEEDVRAAAATFREEGVTAVAIAFLNAYANPEHELAAERALRDAGFEGEISLSHVVSGEYREYERTSTTVIDAFVRGRMSHYLARLADGLAAGRFGGTPLVTRSGGGAMTFEEAEQRPFETVTSGPVAGAEGGAELAHVGLSNVVTADVGGTSFDTCLILDGRLHRSSTRGRSRAGRCRRRGGRALDRQPAAARSPTSTSAACCASGREAPAPTRARRRTAAAAPSRPSPTLRRSWACSPRATSRAGCTSTSTPPGRPIARSPRRWTWAQGGGARRSRSSTRTWRTRSARSRSSRARIHARRR